MNKSTKSPITKRRLIVAAALVAVIVLARPFGNYVHSRALESMRRGDAQTNVTAAKTWYQVAATLAPHDPEILIKLASAHIRTDHGDDALRAAARSIDHGAGSRGYVAKSQALLELGKTDGAIEAAKKAGRDDQTMLGLAYAVAGNHYHLSAVIGSLGTSRAAQTLIGVKNSHLSLAQELYVLGLLRSSQRVLAKYPVENSQFYLLKARVTLELGQNNKKSLEEGRGLLKKGIALSPERIDLRQLLQAVNQKLGDTAAAGEQGSKIKALQSGKV